MKHLIVVATFLSVGCAPGDPQGGREDKRPIGSGAWSFDATGSEPGFRRVTFSRDGKRLFRLGAEITVWEVETGKLICTLDKSETYFCLAVSEDGKRVLAGDSGGSLALWDGHTGRRLWLVNSGQGWIHACALSSDTRLAVTGGNGPPNFDPLLVWDVENVKIQHVLQGPRAAVASVAFSKDSRLIASGTKDNVQLWDATRGKLLETFEGGGDGNVAFTADDKKLFSRGSAKLRQWDLETGAVLAVLDAPTKDSTDAAISPDGRLYLSGDRTFLTLWDVHTRKAIRRFQKSGAAAVAFSFDGRYTASTGDTLDLWDIQT